MAKSEPRGLHGFFKKLLVTATRMDLEGVVESTDGWQGLAAVTTVREWIDGAWRRLETDFFRTALEQDGKLVVYRCVRVSDPKLFLSRLKVGGQYYDWKGLGIYWSYDPEAAECIFGSVGVEVYMTALVDKIAVDWHGTVEANFDPGMEREREIRLHSGAEIEVVSVTYISEDKPVSWSIRPGGRGVMAVA